MTTERVKRKLIAILSADVAGYSRLMGKDEVTTVHKLKKSHKVMADLITRFRGRVIDSPGDNLLAEFLSVVDAIECAVEIQKELKNMNRGLSEDIWMQFRIGINLGDVITDGDRIYGNGVNIAARLESLAEAGGIYFSRTVYDQIRNKLNLKYDYLGERDVKNIDEPLRVYRVALEANAGVSELRKTIRLPDKPSIAVLPFVNMSGNPEQEYFSDGLTEDLITDLSKISALFVIARNTVFTYKGRAVKIEDVGRELGVRYVVEGSVRKAKNKIRITAQLVDATSGGHLWAERYDRDLEDIFSLQDEVVKKIVSALAIKLTAKEQESLACRCKGSCNIEAYDYHLRGLEYLFRFTQDANIQAREMFQRAVELDDRYAPALCNIGDTFLYEWTFGWSQDEEVLEKAFESAQEAIAIDDSLPQAYCLLGNIYLWQHQHEKAIAELQKAIVFEPNNADWLVELGSVLSWSGRPEEALGLIEKAMRLNPRHPDFYLWHMGHAYFLLEQYEEAVSAFQRTLNINPNFHPSYFYLAASWWEQGREKEARNQIGELLRIWPDGSLESAKRRLPYKDEAVLERVSMAVGKSGLM